MASHAKSRHTFARNAMSADALPVTASNREAILGDMLAATCAIPDEWTRASLLAKLAPRLPKILIADALAAACAISDEGMRASLLAKLAPRLPKILIADALAAARAISDEGVRASLLAEDYDPCCRGRSIGI
jgi:hypothetical protein